MKKYKVICTAMIVIAASITTQAAEDEDLSFLDALTKGSPNINVRARYEHGDQDGSESSDAFTIRTRLGYGTKQWQGFKGYVEFEDVSPLIDDDDYNQAGLNEGGEGKTVEADETVIGGKKRNKHKSKRNPKNIGAVGKEIAFSLVERGGHVRSFHVPAVNAKTLRPILLLRCRASPSS